MKFFLAAMFLLTATNFYAQIDTIKTYYPNGNLQSQIVYENNIRQGDASFYWENGKLKEKSNYVNDKVTGTVIAYYENGNIKEMFSLENGRMTGVTSYYDSTGKLNEDVIFEDGIRKGQEFLLVGEYREEDYQKLLAEWKNRQLKKNNSENNFSLPPAEDEKKIMDDDPAYYMNAEIMPEPIGGMNTIYKKLIYPEDAKKNNIEGTVKILAFIEKNGEVSSAQVLEGIGYGCDETARLSVYYTRFKPGLQKGQRVKVQMVIPIEFKLNNESK
jgi:TonB family protein